MKFAGYRNRRQKGTFSKSRNSQNFPLPKVRASPKLGARKIHSGFSDRDDFMTNQSGSP